MFVLLPVIVFLIGVSIGSFINVVVYRTNAGKGLGGRSCCTQCHHVISWWELIPVIGFLILRGKCRQCRTAISAEYPLVEGVTGLLFLGIYARYVYAIDIGPIDALQYMFRDMVFASILITLFLYDLKYFLILDRFSLPAMGVAVGVNLWMGVSLSSMLLAAAVVGGFFLLQFSISRGRWIGGGDIRMGVLMGLMLGWPLALLAVFFAYALGAIVGLFLLRSKKAEWKSHLPFGTFLAVGTLVTLVWGGPILHWYMAQLGF